MVTLQHRQQKNPVIVLSSATPYYHNAASSFGNQKATTNTPKTKDQTRKQRQQTGKTTTMASTIVLSNANNFLLFLPSTSSSPNSPCQVTRRRHIVCKETSTDLNSPTWSRRGVSMTVLAATTLLFGYKGRSEANAAILEADEDQELLEKVKKDRKKRLERQGVILSSDNETALLQDLVYKLSKVGRAIEKEDLTVASSVLGPGIDTKWVQKVNFALNQLSSTGEEKVEVDNFNINLASLIASVDKNDIPTTKASFVAVASAFKKWATLAGLVQKLKGI